MQIVAPNAPTFIKFYEIFYQYLTDKIYNNKYFCHQNPGPLSSNNCQIWAKI